MSNKDSKKFCSVDENTLHLISRLTGRLVGRFVAVGLTQNNSVTQWVYWEKFLSAGKKYKNRCFLYKSNHLNLFNSAL